MLKFMLLFLIVLYFGFNIIFLSFFNKDKFILIILSFKIVLSFMLLFYFLMGMVSISFLVSYLSLFSLLFLTVLIVSN